MLEWSLFEMKRKKKERASCSENSEVSEQSRNLSESEKLNSKVNEELKAGEVRMLEETDASLEALKAQMSEMRKTNRKLKLATMLLAIGVFVGILVGLGAGFGLGL